MNYRLGVLGGMGPSSSQAPFVRSRRSGRNSFTPLLLLSPPRPLTLGRGGAPWACGPTLDL